MALTRRVFTVSNISNVNNFVRISEIGRLENAFVCVSVRTRKHYDPKFKWLRGQKFIPVELPDFSKDSFKTQKKLKERFREMNLPPPRFWKERPMTITSSHEIINPYEPPPADGKASILSKEKVSSLATTSKNKMTTMLAIRKIKSYDSNFDIKMFPQYAHDLYVKAHTVLMNKDPDELSEFVTEKANFDMLSGLKNYTLKWKFIESLEPPVVVQAVAAEVVTKTNLFAQVTVRFHTKQSLAIYDRFGRLTYGSEILAKDVLEYVVFEKHINYEYGTWRLHGKIIPNWLVTSSPSARTYRVQEEVEDDEDEYDVVEEDYDQGVPLTTEIVEKEGEAKATS